MTTRNKMTYTIILVVMLILTGCMKSKYSSPKPTENTRNRFTARSKSADGAMVAWGGYSEGYNPGEKVEFDLLIENDTNLYWEGRYCLLLLARESHLVVASLEQRLFSLEPGIGFSDTINAKLPQNLESGSYGLSLVVSRPGFPVVDLVHIQIGEDGEERRRTTQQDMDASLAACPPVEKAGESGLLVQLAKADLAQRLTCSSDQIDVKSIEPVSFPDASLGVPEPDKSYAQVITPGYVIELIAGGEIYRYHASQERVVAVVGDDDRVQVDQITIQGVQVSSTEVTVQGSSTLSDGTCLNISLWAEGEQEVWWPSETCAPVANGHWQFKVGLDAGKKLQPGVQYMLRAFLPGGPDITSVFPFDLDGPPTQSP